MALSGLQLTSFTAQGCLRVSSVEEKYSLWNGAQEEYRIISFKKRIPDNSWCSLIPKNMFFEGAR